MFQITLAYWPLLAHSHITLTGHSEAYKLLSQNHCQSLWTLKELRDRDQFFIIFSVISTRLGKYENN